MSLPELAAKVDALAALLWEAAIESQPGGIGSMDDVAAQLDRLRAELEAFDREFQRLAAEQRETGGERDAS
jgi:hypothetical protein